MRYKNQEWDMPAGEPNGYGNNVHSWDSIKVSVLMDIRDELQSLNRLLNCPNTTSIPRVLREIRRNTTRRKKKK